MRLLILLVAMALLSGQVKPAPVPLSTVRVYIFTATSGDKPTGEERGRLDSLEDLREALDRKRSEFTLVSHADEAQVTVELMNREERDIPVGGFGGASVSRFRDTMLRLRVSTRDVTSDLKGVGQGTWKSAAKDAAERLVKWVNNHLHGRSAMFDE